MLLEWSTGLLLLVADYYTYNQNVEDRQVVSLKKIGKIAYLGTI